jgi:hypothetical protein
MICGATPCTKFLEPLDSCCITKRAFTLISGSWLCRRQSDHGLYTACVSFIRFFKSAIFVSKFLSSSFRVARSFCSLIIRSSPIANPDAHSTIRALDRLSLTSRVETFSSSPARYRSFNIVQSSAYMALPPRRMLVGSCLLTIAACQMIDD